jgi:hypothetical protein
MGRVRARVAGADGKIYDPALRRGAAEQSAAALVGIGLFAVEADCVVDLSG